MSEIVVKNAQHYDLRERKAEFKKNDVKTVCNGTETLTFLGPKIWKIVPDYRLHKKSNSPEDFKLKMNLRNPENCPCR